MNLSKIKIIAGKILNIGKNRIKINESKINDEFKPEFTRLAIKQYLKDNVILVKKIKGTTRHVLKTPVKDLRGKKQWILQVRRLRSKLKEFRNTLNNKLYRTIYLKIKSNIIKTRKQLQKAVNDKL